jgi:hypothetical protein
MRTVTGTGLLAVVIALSGCSVSVDTATPAGPGAATGRPESVSTVEAAGQPAATPSAQPSAAGRASSGRPEEATASERAVPPAGPSTGPVTATPAAPGATSATPAPGLADPVNAVDPVDPVDPAASVDPAAQVEPAVPAEPAPSVEPPPEDDGQLRRGDSGPEVLALQQRLSELGYWLGTPDGSFGSLTTQAVLAAQKAAGLSRDGVVGPRTLAALSAGTRPVARGSGDGVEIDLDRQLLLVVRGGQVRTVLNTSTGVPGRYDTPRGSFRVQRAIDGLRVAPLGELWRPRYFNGGIAVHGSPSIPAHPASHGCARLSDAAIDLVWAEDLMPVGSSVTVY